MVRVNLGFRLSCSSNCTDLLRFVRAISSHSLMLRSKCCTRSDRQIVLTDAGADKAEGGAARAPISSRLSAEQINQAIEELADHAVAEEHQATAAHALQHLRWGMRTESA